MPIAIGGIEASLRRFAHYDYWDDKVRRSILVDSGADLLMFGMGERSVVEIADAMDAGIHIKDITYVPGTCYLTHSLEEVADVEEIPSFETVCTDKDAYGRGLFTPTAGDGWYPWQAAGTKTWRKLCGGKPAFCPSEY